jgi:dihydrodipicolinate synthase/N-acetylneuraminate lyase
MLRGALAASVTPLREAGAALDEDAFAPLVEHFVEAGLDGILVLGTAGEGILLEEAERRLVADLFLQASEQRLQVAVQCGAQSTAETVRLAAHAAEVGANAVVVIGPPYFRLDERAQLTHFLAAAMACAPLPFYVYEFASTSGYAVAPSVLRQLRESAPNMVGLKVSDTPWAAFESYLLPGFDIFVGPEALIHQGLESGATGAVSALASAFPREVAAVVRHPTVEGALRLGEIRAFVERFPRQAALKRLLARQGVQVREDVRAPLRTLTVGERDVLGQLVAESDHSEPLARLVPDPRARLLECRKCVTQLVDRGLRIDDVPDHEADDHPAVDSSFWRSALICRWSSASSWPKSSR